jgi:two-component system cell cycle response regulator DivK
MNKDISQLHFLYVEDDPLSVEVMVMILRHGVGTENISLSRDSVDFMNRVRSLPSKPDIILLDIHVQPVSGLEMLSMLKSDPNYSKIPVVALTASVMNEEVQRLRQAGFDSGISKPVSVRTFPALIQRIANGEKVWHI